MKANTAIFIFFLGFILGRESSFITTKKQTTKEENVVFKKTTKEVQQNIISPKKSKDSELVQIKSLTAVEFLEEGSTDKAVNKYLEQRNIGSKEEARSNNDIKQYLDHLIENKNLVRASSICESFLKKTPNSFFFLKYMGLIREQQKLFTEALSFYYLAKDYSLNPIQAKEIDQMVNSLVKSKQDLLIEEKNWQKLINFYQFIIEKDPDNIEYNVALAELLIKNKQALLALDHLEPFQNNLLYKKKIDHLIKQAKIIYQFNTSENNQIEIPLIPYKNQYIISVKLNDYKEINLLFDTGASMTSVT